MELLKNIKVIGVQNQDFLSIWIQDASFIRELIFSQYKGAGITTIEIHRRDFGAPSLTIEIHAARPALFIGRETQTLDHLRDMLVTKLYCVL